MTWYCPSCLFKRGPEGLATAPGKCPRDALTLLAWPEPEHDPQGLIASGGFGWVFRSRRSPQEVIKLPRFDDSLDLTAAVLEESAILFRHECAILRSAPQPWFPVVYHTGQIPLGPQASQEPTTALPFMVMEYLVGASPLTWIRGLPGPERVAAAIGVIAELCTALDAAEQAWASGGSRRRFAHRDLKPGNILVTGNPPSVRIIDLGGAVASWDTVTMRGLGVSVHYCAPEQLDAGPEEQSDDRQWDVWALGVLLCELLTGHHMGKAMPDGAYEGWLRGSDPWPRLPPLPTPPSVQEALQSVLDGALARDPVRRFVSAAELGRKLRAIPRVIPVAAGRPDIAALVADARAGDQLTFEPGVHTVDSLTLHGAEVRGSGPTTEIRVRSIVADSGTRILGCKLVGLLRLEGSPRLEQVEVFGDAEIRGPVRFDRCRFVGRGIHFVSGSSVVNHCRFEGSGVGAAVRSSAATRLSECELVDTQLRLVSGTLVATKTQVQAPVACAVQDGKAILHRTTLDGSVAIEVIGGTVRADECTLRAEHGVSARGGSITLTECAIVAGERGIAAHGGSTSITLVRTRIESDAETPTAPRGQPPAAATLRTAVHVSERASGEFDGCEVSGPWAIAFHSSDGANTRFVGCTCDGAATGLVAERDAHPVLDRCRITGERALVIREGSGCTGSGSTLTARDGAEVCVEVGNGSRLQLQDCTIGGGGVGARASRGSIELERCRVSGAHAGVHAGPLSSLVLRESEVVGATCCVADGADLRVRGGGLLDSSSCGLDASGSRVELEGVTLRGGNHALWLAQTQARIRGCTSSETRTHVIVTDGTLELANCVLVSGEVGLEIRGANRAVVRDSVFRAQARSAVVQASATSHLRLLDSALGRGCAGAIIENAAGVIDVQRTVLTGAEDAGVTVRGTATLHNVSFQDVRETVRSSGAGRATQQHAELILASGAVSPATAVAAPRARRAAPARDGSPGPGEVAAWAGEHWIPQPDLEGKVLAPAGLALKRSPGGWVLRRRDDAPPPPLTLVVSPWGEAVILGTPDGVPGGSPSCLAVESGTRILLATPAGVLTLHLWAPRLAGP